MNKTIFFLSGTPRSGSTLIGSILSQHPSITVTPTSPLLDLLCYTNESFSKIQQQYTFDEETVTTNVYSGIIESFYKHIDTPIIIDKHRGWTKNVIPAKMFISPNPKILCTNRPISEIITSYIKLILKNGDQDNFVDNSLRKKGLKFTTENRARCLWGEYISESYQSTVEGLKLYRSNIHLINYDDLMNNPKDEMNKIYSFLEIAPYEHKFNNIDNACAEVKDKAWGLEGLHTIRPNLKKTSTPPEELLGAYLTSYFNQFNIKDTF